MTVLSVVQNFCRRTNLSVPAVVLGSTDEQVQQVRALLEEEGTELADRGDWQELTFEATHTTLAVEDQGTVDSICTNGFDHFLSDSAWDRTLQLPLVVLDGQEWAASKAVQTLGPQFQIRLRGGHLLSSPAPTAGNTWAFEYVSENWILGDDGVTYKSAFTLDTDTILLPEKLVLAGLRWRWKKEKGFDYAEDFNSYEKLVSKALGHNKMQRRLSMSGPSEDRGPGIVVPQGSWSIP